MKSQLYNFKDGNVTLSFSFEENTEIKENKQKFIGLLKQATSELEAEETE